MHSVVLSPYEPRPRVSRTTLVVLAVSALIVAGLVWASYSSGPGSAAPTSIGSVVAAPVRGPLATGDGWTVTAATMADGGGCLAAQVDAIGPTPLGCAGLEAGTPAEQTITVVANVPLGDVVLVMGKAPAGVVKVDVVGSTGTAAAQVGPAGGVTGFAVVIPLALAQYDVIATTAAGETYRWATPLGAPTSMGLGR